jgi:hypothetical protein
MTVARLDREMGSAELTEWMAYARIEPFGEDRADLRAAIVAKTVADVSRRKGHAGYRIERFLAVRDGEAERRGSAESLMRALAGMGKNAGTD